MQENSCMSRRLTTEGEQHWQELRQHLEWNRGFALFFYFASDTTVSDILHERLSNFFIGQTTRMQEVYYQPEQTDWVDNTLRDLLDREGYYQQLNSPLWIALHHFQQPDAIDHYRRLLLSLNERRDVWRKNYLAPMIFILPECLKTEMSTIAPDLWSIRILSETMTQDWLSCTSNASKHADTDRPNHPSYTQILAVPETQQAYLDEWERLLEKMQALQPKRWFNFLRPKNPPQREYLVVASRALEVYQRYGHLKSARRVAEKMLAWARELTDKNTPESLRDLSVSLDKRCWARRRNRCATCRCH